MERNLTNTQKEALALEHFFPHYMRERCERVLFATSVFFLSMSVLFSLSPTLNGGQYNVLWPVSQGLFLIFFSLLLITILLEAYFRSICLRLLSEKKKYYSFGVLLALNVLPKKKDDLSAFFHSHLGKALMKRLGLSEESVQHFLEERVSRKGDFDLFPQGTFRDLSLFMYDQDESLRDYLVRTGIEKEVWGSAARVVEDSFHHKIHSRSFLKPVFRPNTKHPLVFSEAVKREMNDFESLYQVTFTEQARKQLTNFLKDHSFSYLSKESRYDLFSELVEDVILSHRHRAYGKNIIMPADTRSFLIVKKAEEM